MYLYFRHVLVERSFSAGRDLILLRRASLKASTIEDVSQLRAWMRFERSLEP